LADSSSQGGKKRMIMKRRLEGKTALVTGASRGIGAGIVRVMAGEGATVLAADLTKDGAVGDVQSVVLDVTSAEQWEVCAERIRDQFGRLDILVNNAGIVANTSVEDTTLEDWRRVMRVNLDAVFMGCKAMLPLLRVAGQANPSGGIGHQCVFDYGHFRPAESVRLWHVKGRSQASFQAARRGMGRSGL
jgi:NAD(P)-dependent dehydrogenase (short-subunit alcohol dehydrogenase family)